MSFTRGCYAGINSDTECPCAFSPDGSIIWADALAFCALGDLVDALRKMTDEYVEWLEEAGYDESDIADHEQVTEARAALTKLEG